MDFLSQERSIMKKMTRKGAAQVTADFDEMANLVQNHYATLGIPKKIALDFAYRCDLLSDAIERTAAADEEGQSVDHGESGTDANMIGDKTDGAHESDADEPHTSENFTQQEHHELAEKQEGGDLPHAEKSAANRVLRVVAEQLLKLAEDEEEVEAGEHEEVEAGEHEEEAKKASASTKYDLFA